MVNCLLVGIALFVMNRPEAKNAMSKNFLRLVRVPSSLLCISVKVGAIPSLFCQFKGSLTFSSSTLFSLNISIYILHAPLCTFPLVLTRKICLTSKASQGGDLLYPYDLNERFKSIIVERNQLLVTQCFKCHKNFLMLKLREKVKAHIVNSLTAFSPLMLSNISHLMNQTKYFTCQ